ncbi:MAG: bifunctional 2-polyprenyl-6-hydroxyphenol methylase/3-demethylubiquinol 3-O-methyltransferase UbiG [Pseudomonadota bacterium]
MSVVNNEFYNLYGDRWYTAKDDPIALLRAETRVKLPWVLSKLKSLDFSPAKTAILDVGCGAGFLANPLASEGFQVTGIDMSDDSLSVARRFDSTKSVNYLQADAYSLPFADQTFDVVTAMDFLEHVEDPSSIIREFSRVLKPGGVFIFHTFNRNFLAYLVIIKFVEWFVKNTPKNMHILRLFIKPSELIGFCRSAGFKEDELTGIKPKFSHISWRDIKSGEVPDNFEFELTSSLKLSYMGSVIKI